MRRVAADEKSGSRAVRSARCDGLDCGSSTSEQKSASHQSMVLEECDFDDEFDDDLGGSVATASTSQRSAAGVSSSASSTAFTPAHTRAVTHKTF